MGRTLRILAVAAALGCACGWFADDGTVEVTQDSGYVIIKNGLEIEIYYMIGENEFLHPASWMPSFEHPSIRGGERKSIQYENVPNGKDTGVVKGDLVAVYWWDNGYRGADDLHVEYITIKE